MILIKQILIPILSLIILSTPIPINFCLATEPSTAEGSLSSYEENHPDHRQATCPNCRNRSPCQYVHSCCNLAPPSTISYLAVLNSNPLNTAEILFQPLEIIQSLFHPPRIRF
jgi:hypothetical protein